MIPCQLRVHSRKSRGGLDAQIFAICVVFAAAFAVGLGASSAYHGMPALGFPTSTTERSDRSDGENNRDLQLDPINFGVIESGGRRTAITWLRNSGPHAVVLKKIITSCDCLSLQITEPEVPADGRIPVLIDFNDDQGLGFVGPISIEIHVVHSQGQQVLLGTIDLEVCADPRVRQLAPRYR